MVDAGQEDRGPWVLIVDDEPSATRTASLWLERDGCRCLIASSAEEALQKLEKAAFDVVLTDIRMPEMSGIDLLKAVKERDSTIQVIVMTGSFSIDFAVEAIRSHVDDYLVKPFEPEQLSHAVKRALEHRQLLKEKHANRLRLEEKVSQQAQQIEVLFLDGLSALAAAIEARDRYTRGHLDRVSQYAVATGYELGLEQQQLWNVWLGSLFHDVGKLAVPDAILNKEGPLTDEEYAQMKTHPELGAGIIEKISFLQPALPGILNHHERWDGTGYPAGLKGEEISIEGRILAVCDAFDAMCTDRPYRKGGSEEEAVDALKSAVGTHFDPKALDAFLQAREKGFRVEFPTSPYAAVTQGVG